MLHRNDEICNGKIRYTKREAKLKKIENTKFRNPDLRIYQCQMCFDYHLTSSKMFEVWETKRKEPARIIRKKRFQFIPTMTLDSD